MRGINRSAISCGGLAQIAVMSPKMLQTVYGKERRILLSSSPSAAACLVTGDLEAAALAVVSVAALGDRLPHEFTQETFERIGRFGILSGGGGQRAAVPADDKVAAFLVDLGHATEVVEESAGGEHAFS